MLKMSVLARPVVEHQEDDAEGGVDADCEITHQSSNVSGATSARSSSGRRGFG